jgi:hypothetical protein
LTSSVLRLLKDNNYDLLHTFLAFSPTSVCREVAEPLFQALSLTAPPQLHSAYCQAAVKVNDARAVGVCRHFAGRVWMSHKAGRVTVPEVKALMRYFGVPCIRASVLDDVNDQKSLFASFFFIKTLPPDSLAASLSEFVANLATLELPPERLSKFLSELQLCVDTLAALKSPALMLGCLKAIDAVFEIRPQLVKPPLDFRSTSAFLETGLFSGGNFLESILPPLNVLQSACGVHLTTQAEKGAVLRALEALCVKISSTT